MRTLPDREFVLSREAEVLTIIERMRRERIVASIDLEEGHAIVTSILEVRRNPPRDGRPGAPAIVFDIAREPEQNRMLFDAHELHFVSHLDQVPITFETGTPKLITLADGPAGIVAMPSSIVRLQRRDAFRAALPSHPPVRCTMIDHDGHALPAQAIDLSATGTALLVEEANEATVPGSEHDLVLSLPEIGTISVAATLRTVTSASGATPRVRMGFRFESLPAPTAQRLQKYVQHLEVHQLRILKMRDW